MRAVTLTEAESQLGALLNAAERGEHVLIRRTGKRAVALVPVQEDELAAWPEIPATAVATFAAELAAERASGSLTRLGASAKSAAKALRQ